MQVFMNNYMNDDSIRFFKHQYRINARSISREQWLRMLNENVKLWGSSMVPWCGYTDDLILFMQDIHLMQRATTIFDEVFTNYGLCINVSKTESMSLNSTEFKYIDSFISQNKPNMGDIEINHRIQMAYAKFATMTNLIQNSKIHLNTRVKVLNSFVRSRLTHARIRI